MRFVRWLGTSIVAVALATVVARTSVVRADGLADEAELQFQLGAEHYRAADYRGALEHFLASNRLVPNSNVVFNIARTYEAMGRFPDAHRYYIDALEAQNDNPRVQAEIQAAIARIAPNVAVLRVETDPPGATIYIDRRDLGSRGRSPRPLAFPEGTYRVIVALDGYEPAESGPVVAHAGTETPVHLTLRRIVGTVRIEGDTGASVRVDDERGPVECTTPCALELAPGPHTLHLSREGFQNQARTINVFARQATTVHSQLAPLTGTVVVRADEDGALVEIDGRSVGFTPAVVPNIPVGTRHVRVTLRGFTPVEREISVRSNEQTELLDLRVVPEREITAVSRLNESIEDAPSSLSIITSQEIRAFAYPTIAEALRGTRGVYLSNDRSYWSAGIRGLGEPNDYGNRVLVLSDGAVLNDNLLNSSYIGSDGRADLHDIERIEVVRGPGSLLYGTGAFSGVINLVTRRRDEPTGAHAAIGTYDNGVAEARAGGTVNFGNNRGAWVSVSGARSDGSDLTIPVGPIGGPTTPTVVNQVDSFVSQGTAGRVWWGPLTAQFFYHSREQHIPVGAYGTNLNDPTTRFIDTRFLGEIRFEPRLSNNVQLFTRVHANRYTFHGDYAYAPTPTVEDYYGTWFGAESRIVWTPLERTRITVGGEGQWHPQVEIHGCCYTDMSGATGPYVNSSTPYGLAAGYALLESDITRAFRLSAGMRVDYYSTFGAILVPRAAAIFRPTSGGVLKLMFGRAFRAPSAYELYYNDGGQTQLPGVNTYTPPMSMTPVSMTVRPESVWQGEIEFSQRFLEDWVALVAVYASYVENLIETLPAPQDNSLIQYQNSPFPVATGGFDVELRREFRRGWMFSAMFGYQRAEYLTGAEFHSQTDWNAGWVPNAPEYLASLKGIVPIVERVANGALRVSVESGRRIRRDANDTTNAAVVADAVISGFVQRFGIYYAVGVYNLFDWRYEVPVTPSFASATMPQNGRTLRVDLMANF